MLIKLVEVLCLEPIYTQYPLPMIGLGSQNFPYNVINDISKFIGTVCKYFGFLSDVIRVGLSYFQRLSLLDGIVLSDIRCQVYIKLL